MRNISYKNFKYFVFLQFIGMVRKCIKRKSNYFPGNNFINNVSRETLSFVNKIISVKMVIDFKNKSNYH